MKVEPATDGGFGVYTAVETRFIEAGEDIDIDVTLSPIRNGESLGYWQQRAVLVCKASGDGGFLPGILHVAFDMSEFQDIGDFNELIDEVVVISVDVTDEHGSTHGEQLVTLTL